MNTAALMIALETDIKIGEHTTVEIGGLTFNIDTIWSTLVAGAVVINISSDAAVEHYETWGGYGATKAALDHLTLTLAAEEPTYTFYSVDPGDMRTAMHQAAFPGEDISDRPEPETVAPHLVALIDSGLPSGRYRLADLATPVPTDGVATLLEESRR